MLILSRKKNQSIVIETDAGDITITITKTSSERTVVGVDAPKQFPIKRGEHDNNNHK